VSLFWAGPGFWWGWRLAHLGVVAEESELVVHNPVKTYRIAYAEIVDVRLEKRRSSPWIRAALFFLQFDRSVGVLEVKGREEPLEMYSTESFWFAIYGRFFSQTPSTSAAKVQAIRTLWLARHPA